MTREINELPLMNFSSFMGSFSFDLFGAFSSKTSKSAVGGAKGEVACADASADVIKPCAKRSAVSFVTAPSPAGVITQSDLDTAVAEGIMTEWEPEKWESIRTLATAAAGDGTVELMASKEREGQQVAVKRLPWKLMRSSPEDFHRYNPKAAEQPWTDVSIVKHLNSIQFPYACELLGVFLHGSDQVNIVTSLATRGDLFSWVQNDKSAQGEARESAMRPIITQMLKAVQWLHDMGIAHRDLSAENVMLTDEGEKELQVKIIDFGMATLSRTARKEPRGKRSYQAPEMHESATYDTFLVDNFALGVIVYCMGVHYYPWEYTKPGKDRSTEFARTYGIEKFLEKKRMPGNKKPVAESFSQSYLELLCGLLDFNPEMRFSLGEACFHPIPLDKLNPSWKSKLSEGDSLSEISTACSTLESLPPFQEEDEDEVDEIGDRIMCDKHDVQTLQCVNLRLSVWDCKWLL